MKLAPLLMITALGLLGCGGETQVSKLHEAWDVNNNPALLRSRFEVAFAALPVSGEVERKPWTDSYWPSFRGGIANRWNDPESPDAFTYSLHNKDALRQMSSDELRRLSPAEKYDILQGRLDFPLVAAERRRTNPDNPGWFGLCHGWAPASIAFEEPRPVSLRSPLGVDVPLGSSDVKALLTFAQQYQSSARIVGDRCNHEVGGEHSSENGPECRDMNAGSFHVIVSNMIGVSKEAFIADLSREYQVWNHPIFGFESIVKGESSSVPQTAAPGTKTIVTVETTIKYISELGESWDARPFAEFSHQASSRRFEYTLELDAVGDIVGGEWVTREHPDFVWTQDKVRFSGYLSGVSEIYEASIRQ